MGSAVPQFMLGEDIVYSLEKYRETEGVKGDKAKGIICKPMPKVWHDRHCANKMENEKERIFYQSIVADKKPYFMKYIYPALMKQYNTYIKNTDKKALREFQMTVGDLKAMSSEELSEEQREFLSRYDHYMPVGMGDCVMNKICRRFEKEFDGYIAKHKALGKFDFEIMKSGAEYSISQYKAVKRLYDDYNKRLKSYVLFSKYERVNENDCMQEISVMNEEFKRECSIICPNRDALCDIIIDLCYRKSSTKKFAWSMCGDDIIRNLLKKNGGIITYPAEDEQGDIKYKGSTFSLSSKKIEAE